MSESTVKLETQFQGDFLEIRDIITRNRKHYPNSIFPPITVDQFQDYVPNRQQQIQIKTKIYVSQKYAQLRLRKRHFFIKLLRDFQSEFSYVFSVYMHATKYYKGFCVYICLWLSLILNPIICLPRAFVFMFISKIAFDIFS